MRILAAAIFSGLALLSGAIAYSSYSRAHDTAKVQHYADNSGPRFDWRTPGDYETP